MSKKFREKMAMNVNANTLFLVLAMSISARILFLALETMAMSISARNLLVAILVIEST